MPSGDVLLDEVPPRSDEEERKRRQALAKNKDFASALSTALDENTINNILIPRLRWRSQLQFKFFALFLLVLSAGLAYTSLMHFVPAALLAAITLGMGQVLGIVIGLSLGALVLGIIIATLIAAFSSRLKLQAPLISSSVLGLAGLAALILIPALGIVVGGSSLWTACILALAALLFTLPLEMLFALRFNRTGDQMKAMLVSTSLMLAALLPAVFFMPFPINGMLIGFMSIILLVGLFMLGLTNVWVGYKTNNQLAALASKKAATPEPLLARALREGMAITVKLLLEQGADPRATDASGNCYVEAACFAKVSQLTTVRSLSSFVNSYILLSFYGLNLFNVDAQSKIFIVELAKKIEENIRTTNSLVILDARTGQNLTPEEIQQNILNPLIDKMLVTVLTAQLKTSAQTMSGQVLKLSLEGLEALKPFPNSLKLITDHLVANQNRANPDAPGYTNADILVAAGSFDFAASAEFKQAYAEQVKGQIPVPAMPVADLSNLIGAYAICDDETAAASIDPQQDQEWAAKMKATVFVEIKTHPDNTTEAIWKWVASDSELTNQRTRWDEVVEGYRKQEKEIPQEWQDAKHFFNPGKAATTRPS